MSPLELIFRYLGERGRLPALAALSLLMASTGSTASARLTASGVGLAAATALLLILAFRIWDDLEDREYDALRHPTRITVVARSVRPLERLAAALFIAGGLLIGRTADAGLRLLVLCAAALALGVWYSARSPSRRGLANSHVVLLKYPILAFAASPVTPSPIALAAVYLGLCAYEVADDRALRASLGARRLAMSEGALSIIAGATFVGGRLL
jgi:4-hydroxybenzoate polyprenyltransferase